MKRIRGFLLGSFLFFYFFAAAQENPSSGESLDDLFNGPQDDVIITETETQTDYTTQLEQNSGILFKGNFSASGGVSAGWSRFPWAFSGEKNDFGVSPLALSSAHLFIDARPIPQIKIHADIYTDVDKNAISSGWAGPVIEELYGEYDLAGFTYFRVGQFTSTWASGRIFKPGNLLINSQKGFSLGITFPTLLDGIKYVAIADKSAIKAGSGRKDIKPSELIHTLLIDKAFGPARLSLGARYQQYEGLKGLFSCKVLVSGVELFGDLVAHTKDFSGVTFKTLAGVFYEWEKVRIYAEYFYDGTRLNANDHNLGAAVQFKKIFNSPLDFKVLAEHTFSDNSGNVIPMLSISPWKNININFGVPFIWGVPGTRYLKEKSGASYSRSDIINDIPRDKQLSFILSVTFSTSF